MVFEIKERKDIINDILVSIATNTDKVNDFNPGSVIRVLSEAIAQQIYEQYTDMQSIYESTKINLASGSDLDDIGAIVGVERQGGKKATGYALFRKKTGINYDFTIPANTVFETLPDDNGNTKEYITTEDVTLSSAQQTYTLTYKQGIVTHYLGENARSGSYTGTRNGQPVDWFNNYSGYSKLPYVITNLGSIEVIDACDSTSGWVETGDSIAVAVDNTNKLEGTGSLKLGKTSSPQTMFSYSKTLTTPVNFKDKIVALSLYVDSTVIDNIDNVYVSLFPDADNPHFNSHRIYSKIKAERYGWETLYFNYKDKNNAIKYGNPDLSIEKIEITIVLNKQNYAIPSGKILMDYIFVAEAESKVGTYITIEPDNQPDDMTDLVFKYKLGGIEVPCEAAEVGAEYNITDDNTHLKLKSVVPEVYSINKYYDIINGSDEQTDNEYRDSIKGFTKSPGPNTKTHLRNELLKVDGVVDVLVFDTPVIEVTNEMHVYNSNVSEYYLNQNIAEFIISISNDFNGAPDYTPNVDYTLTSNNSIKWLGANTPTQTGDQFFVNYSIKQLGYVETIVVGDTTPIPNDTVTGIENVINTNKPLGLSITWDEADTKTVDIQGNIVIIKQNEYADKQIKDNVVKALTDWLDSFKIGETLHLGQLYKTITDVNGVLSFNIFDLDGQTVPNFHDIFVDVKTVIRAGDINISTAYI